MRPLTGLVSEAAVSANWKCFGDEHPAPGGCGRLCAESWRHIDRPRRLIRAVSDVSEDFTVALVVARVDELGPVVRGVAITEPADRLGSPSTVSGRPRGGGATNPPRPRTTASWQANHSSIHPVPISADLANARRLRHSRGPCPNVTVVPTSFLTAPVLHLVLERSHPVEGSLCARRHPS